MKRKFISILLAIFLVFIFPSLVFVTFAPRPFKEIEFTFNRNVENFKYTADLIKSNENKFDYIFIEYSNVRYKFLNDEFSSTETSFNDFFNNIIPADNEKIRKLFLKSNVRYISYSRRSDDIEFLMWSAGSKRSRSIVYSDKMYNIGDIIFDSKISYLKNLGENFYSCGSYY